jgi:hypothetical protein
MISNAFALLHANVLYFYASLTSMISATTTLLTDHSSSAAVAAAVNARMYSL